MDGSVDDRIFFRLILDNSGLDAQELENADGAAAVDDDGGDDDEEGRAQDHLPALSDGVPDGQSEGNGSSQAREHHHMLEISGNFNTSTNIQDGWERIDVEESTEENSCKGCTDVDGFKVMLGEGEHGYADVGEDEILRHEVQKIKEVFSWLLRLFRKIVVGVVSLGDSTEQHSNYTSHLEYLNNFILKIG